jgi:CheY-like chemotaxis protein/anti-sigma regulatory factor (Ser/Thr protein kinase)
MFRIQAGAKGIQFRYEPSPHLPPYVFADEKRLRQVLINLLSNAIKYTRQGGVVFRARHRGQISEFEIADTGIGIDTAISRASSSPSSAARRRAPSACPGTGLGLTITKLLAEIMGGEVSVESTIGEGSMFRVRLMLSEASPARPWAVRQRRIIGYRGARMKILAADDDLGHLDLLNELLTPLGFALEIAQNGTICLERAAANPPDLALLDLTMPDMNGWEVARRLRERAQAIPIIIVSANADEQMQAHAFEDTTFVTKPIEVNHLLASIRDALGLDWVYRRGDGAPSRGHHAAADAASRRPAPPGQDRLCARHRSEAGRGRGASPEHSRSSPSCAAWCAISS